MSRQVAVALKACVPPCRYRWKVVGCFVGYVSESRYERPEITPLIFLSVCKTGHQARGGRDARPVADGTPGPWRTGRQARGGRQRQARGGRDMLKDGM